jgi:magnesium transporter
MAIFGNTANIYVSHSQLSPLASSVSRACHVVTTKPPALLLASTRRLYSDACDRSSKATDRRSMQPIGLRHLSWLSKTHSKSVESNGFSDFQEEEAKAAILEKVMKGRQPTDLMLRCG